MWSGERLAPFLQNTELRTQDFFIQPLDYRFSTKDKSNNYNVQNCGLGDICKDKKKSRWHRCHPEKVDILYVVWGTTGPILRFLQGTIQKR